MQQFNFHLVYTVDTRQTFRKTPTLTSSYFYYFDEILAKTLNFRLSKRPKFRYVWHQKETSHFKVGLIKIELWWILAIIRGLGIPNWIDPQHITLRAVDKFSITNIFGIFIELWLKIVWFCDINGESLFWGLQRLLIHQVISDVTTSLRWNNLG